jgi:hypothetical protein
LSASFATATFRGIGREYGENSPVKNNMKRTYDLNRGRVKWSSKLKEYAKIHLPGIFVSAKMARVYKVAKRTT